MIVPENKVNLQTPKLTYLSATGIDWQTLFTGGCFFRPPSQKIIMQTPSPTFLVLVGVPRIKASLPLFLLTN
jgi:hypothetical protein